ncbi:hypothetical protein An02g07620 [Aspergillus niger]|uniref:Uncharacterized protein n=2 Tax=Aspergillus niger TaxID=5061 RepID=A2QDM4_ASPNC|nr:hypothetical protein An02g07620 [Aspergillus niger]CAK37725.1 hypothetical protein An02g07620 [Aspergillus niger]
MSWQTATARKALKEDLDSVTTGILVEIDNQTSSNLFSSTRCIRYQKFTSSINYNSTYIRTIEIRVRLRTEATWRNAQTPAPDLQAVAQAVSYRAGHPRQVARTGGWEHRKSLDPAWFCPVKPPAETPLSLSSPHGAVTPDRTSTRLVNERVLSPVENNTLASTWKAGYDLAIIFTLSGNGQVNHNHWNLCIMAVSIRIRSGKRNSSTGHESFQEDPRSAPDPKILRPVTPPDRIG